MEALLWRESFINQSTLLMKYNLILISSSTAYACPHRVALRKLAELALRTGFPPGKAVLDGLQYKKSANRSQRPEKRKLRLLLNKTKY